MLLALWLGGLKMRRETQTKSIKESKISEDKKLVICIFCKSKNTVKWGKRKTKDRGIIQTHKCLKCGKRFTVDNGFYRMRNSESKITMSIDMYLSNLSSRKMRNQLQRHFNHKISHVSILDWVRKYVLKVHKFVDRLKPQLGDRFYADETFIDCENRKDALWCNVDWDTRFISGFHYSTSRNVKEAVKFLKNATKNKKPKFIQTDSAMFYPKAMRKVFINKRMKARNIDRYDVKHIANNVTKTKKHNVRIETVFMKIKDRVEDFRGLKALWSAPILLMGIVLQHNFIENHTTTRALPCELAGLKLEAGVNRWLGLIRLASC